MPVQPPLDKFILWRFFYKLNEDIKMKTLFSIIAITIAMSLVAQSTHGNGLIVAGVGCCMFIAAYLIQDAKAYWTLKEAGIENQILFDLGARLPGKGDAPLLTGVVWIEETCNGFFEAAFVCKGERLSLGGFSKESLAIKAARQYIFGRGVDDFVMYGHQQGQDQQRQGFLIAVKVDPASFGIVDPRTGEFWRASLSQKENCEKQAKPFGFGFRKYGDLSITI